MKTDRLLAVSITFLFLLSGAIAQSLAQPLEITEDSLTNALEDTGPVTVAAGQGLILEFGPANPEDLPIRELTVRDGENKVKRFTDAGFYISFARIEQTPAVYWVVSLFTGGANCCAEYEFFCRPAPNEPVRYLGMTGGHNGEPRKLTQAFVLKDNNLYFQDLDNRFDYFHDNRAASVLVNFPYRYYLLTPVSFKVANTAFKDEYLQAVPAVEKLISQAANAGRTSAPAILVQNGSGRGVDGLHFSDELGRLLVKRTILLLYAREDVKAWQDLQNDVKKYYQTTRWLPELRRDIQRLLFSKPY
jgi:hypothetical protein